MASGSNLYRNWFDWTNEDATALETNLNAATPNQATCLTKLNKMNSSFNTITNTNNSIISNVNRMNNFITCWTRTFEFLDNIKLFGYGFIDFTVADTLNLEQYSQIRTKFLTYRGDVYSYTDQVPTNIAYPIISSRVTALRDLYTTKFG